jgi:hypothetical protein
MVTVAGWTSKPPRVQQHAGNAIAMQKQWTIYVLMSLVVWTRNFTSERADKYAAITIHDSNPEMGGSENAL